MNRSQMMHPSFITKVELALANAKSWGIDHINNRKGHAILAVRCVNGVVSVIDNKGKSVLPELLKVATKLSNNGLLVSLRNGIELTTKALQSPKFIKALLDGCTKALKTKKAIVITNQGKKACIIEYKKLGKSGGFHIKDSLGNNLRNKIIDMAFTRKGGVYLHSFTCWKLHTDSALKLFS